MFKMRQMHANLMRAPGLDFNVEQCEFIEPLQHAIERERRSPFACATHSHLHAMARVASDGRINAAFIRGHAAINQCQITLKTRRSSNCAARSRCARSVLATTI